MIFPILQSDPHLVKHELLHHQLHPFIQRPWQSALVSLVSDYHTLFSPTNTWNPHQTQTHSEPGMALLYLWFWHYTHNLIIYIRVIESVRGSSFLKDTLILLAMDSSSKVSYQNKDITGKNEISCIGSDMYAHNTNYPPLPRGPQWLW